MLVANVSQSQVQFDYTLMHMADLDGTWIEGIDTGQKTQASQSSLFVEKKNGAH